MMCLIGNKAINKRSFSDFSLYLMLAIVFFSGEVFALKVNFGVSQSYENTSNPLHVPEIFDDGSFEDSIVTSSVFLKLKEDSSTLKSTVDLKINYLDYVENVSSDLTRSNLKSSFLWFITPGYYSWYLVDNIVQTQIDVSLIVSESNAQDVNEFLTGPRLKWKLGGSKLELNSYINKFTYSETDNDSTNLLTSLLWRNKMPSGIKLDLRYSTKFVTFDEDESLNSYDQSTVGAGLKYEKKTNTIDIFFGKTFLNSDDVSDSTFRNDKISFKRELTRYSSISLLHSNGLSSKDESLSSGDTVLSGVHFSKESIISYKRSSSVFGMELKLSESERNNLDIGTRDYKRANSVDLYRVLGSRSRINFSYKETFNTVDFGSLDYEDNIYIKSIKYTKKFNNKLSFSAYVSDLSVESDNILRQYTDKKIGLTISIER